VDLVSFLFVPALYSTLKLEIFPFTCIYVLVIFLQRLLETVSGEDNGQLEMLREDSPQTALIPVALSLPHSTSPQPSDIDEPSSSLRELLELKDTFPET
jgi:hypothetical protein